MVGRSVESARTMAGMSVEDLADRTKIRASIIIAIESGDFSACGGDVYARGHLKSIAAVLGLDPDALLAEFDGGSDAG